MDSEVDERIENDSGESVYVDEKAFKDADKKKKGRKIFRIILLSFLLVLAAAFTITFHVMARKAEYSYNPNTIIDGIDMSFQTVDYAEGILKDDVNDYRLTIHFRDGDAVLTAKDVGLDIDVRESLEKIMSSQEPYEWFRFDRKLEYTVERVLSFSDSDIDTALLGEKRLKNEYMIKPENPEIVFNDGVYEAVPGDEGTEIDVRLFRKLLSQHIAAMDTDFYVEAEGCYREPFYTVDSRTVTNCLDKANDYLKSEVTFIYGEQEIPVITSEDLSQMIEIDNAYKVIIDKDAVYAKVEEFANVHDTYGRNRSFRTHDGKYVDVTGYNYGWMLDCETEKELVYKDILGRAPVTRRPDFFYTGYTYHEGNGGIDDVGSSYAEVDLTNQHVYLYINGSLVMDSDCVSGKVTAGMSTPGGLYYINLMQKNAILTGGEEPVPVDYWMRFVRGIGFHDATWRSKFGGDIYYASGSHGCVNLPYNAAQNMYSYVQVGMPVICYWR